MKAYLLWLIRPQKTVSIFCSERAATFIEVLKSIPDNFFGYRVLTSSVSVSDVQEDVITFILTTRNYSRSGVIVKAQILRENPSGFRLHCSITPDGASDPRFFLFLAGCLLAVALISVFLDAKWFETCIGVAFLLFILVGRTLSNFRQCTLLENDLVLAVHGVAASKSYPFVETEFQE